MNGQLTIRGVSEEVGRRLESLSRSRGQSLNATVLEILESAVGVAERRQRLARYTTWTAEDLEEFNEALTAQGSSMTPSGAEAAVRLVLDTSAIRTFGLAIRASLTTLQTPRSSSSPPSSL